MRNVTKPNSEHENGTRCQCDTCVETAIAMADKVSRRGGRSLNVCSTRRSGICIYDDGTMNLKRGEILEVLHRTGIQARAWVA
ncbi:hypothetical protein DOK_11931 [gamma proteobacterium BDW918]|nr:hypothetical protein DOK_11931 [gamma proteobacterium BDW918]